MADTKRDLDAEIKEAQAVAFQAIRNLEIAKQHQEQAVQKVNELEAEKAKQEQKVGQ